MSLFHVFIINTKFWINKIVKRNRFLRPILLRSYEKSVWWGLAVFVVRENAVKLVILDKICELIRQKGFDIVDTRILNNKEKELVSSKCRGGYWPGGMPDAFVVVFDTDPQRTFGNYAKTYPEIDNIRLIKKTDIRVEVNALVSGDERKNFIHATDNSHQAWEYLEVCSTEYSNSIRARVSSLYNIDTE